MIIGTVLVHNKTDKENQAQVDELFSKVTLNKQIIPQFDENGKQLEDAVQEFYTYNDIKEEHEVRFYHMIPFGFTPPSNIDLLNGESVLYCAQNPNPDLKTNGSSRIVQLGADYCTLISDPATFQPDTINTDVKQFSPTDKRVTEDWGDIITKQDVLDRIVSVSTLEILSV